MTQVYDDTARFALPAPGEEYEGDFFANTEDPPMGGHPGHLDGGREMAWELSAQLNAALKAHRAEIDMLRAYCCPQCGHPAAVKL